MMGKQRHFWKEKKKTHYQHTLTKTNIKDIPQLEEYQPHMRGLRCTLFGCDNSSHSYHHITWYLNIETIKI